jgi:tetratricopeptide (TPR) repeat protein
LYRQRDVERLLRLPRSTIRALVAGGFVSPARGPRNSLQYSFQDLIVLRAAQALAAAGVPRHRIARAMRELRQREQSGQYALAFEPPAKGSLSPLGRPKVPPPGGAEWFARARALEGSDDEAAMRAYERAIEADPALVEARINLGLLLHQAGQPGRSESVYRDALTACGPDPLLHYNLGVLLEDTGRRRAALEEYQAALRIDPMLADGHYNLALLYESLGRPKDALRHMARYRRLIAARSR